MLAPLFFANEKFVIMTAFGAYEPTPMEVDAFRSVYAGEVSRNGFDQLWVEELVRYADTQAIKLEG